ncbi:DUF732 domain-containing protein [Mycobacterium sp. SM1]|uniref:DUF732 domain-containing protein n=1 Tax=Mycobacterium sp. SM1 TaxID=2816243 RepID=UPI001BCD5456|nr:DUF732 domain-containing protein [Mycobacterium sp. SM1]MBS4730653.1 DUF732 domain-containing protein [Mycobacterium sp. SM1]
MSDDRTVVGATAALDRAPTGVAYAWGEEPYPDDDTPWQEDSWPVRAAYLLIAAAIAAVAIAAAAIAGMLVLIPPPQPGSHYTLAPGPVQAPIPRAAPPSQAAAPPSQAAAPRKAAPPPAQTAPPAVLPPAQAAPAVVPAPAQAAPAVVPAPRAPRPTQPRPPARTIPAPGPGGFTPAEDQEFLESLEPFGYTFVNPAQVIEWGHHYCRLLQQGESVGEADREMANLIGPDALMLDASAQVAYPTCY